jgi:4-diphosphocytidyl-2-C-methyl-D-erythritol kinase
VSDRATLYLPSRAKLNLVLRIVGRREDGYHLLDTLFHTLDLHDDVVVEHAPQSGGIGITVTADQDQLLVPADDSNLAVKALLLVRAELGERAPGGFQIRLHKRIPNGGGLGGGSSNAAAVLRLSNRILGDSIGEIRLQELAAKLGADVPFFLRGGSQWGRDVGTELHPAEPVQGHFVMLIPPYGCSTVEVYKKHAGLWLDGKVTDSLSSITVPEKWDITLGIGFSNDLERAAEQVKPELGRLRHAVAEAGYALARISGSGSSLFVAVPDVESARQCQRHLQSVLAHTEHRGVLFMQTMSGPEIDADQPSSQVPATLRHHPLDPLC